MQSLLTIVQLLAFFLSTLYSVSAHPPAQNPQIPHTYTFCELKPQRGLKGSFRQPYFRFNIFLRKNSGVTAAFFHQHWKTVHADLTISEPDVGTRLLRYTQVYHDPKTPSSPTCSTNRLKVPRRRHPPTRSPASCQCNRRPPRSSTL